MCLWCPEGTWLLVEIIPDSIIAKSDITSAHFVILEDLYVLSADFGVLPSFLDQTHTPVHHLTRKSRVQSSLCCSVGYIIGV
jgi:hypothetical protein